MSEDFPIPSRKQGSEIVKVKVGSKVTESTASFHIHKDLLKSSTPYFSALENFSEGHGKRLALDWACPIAFEVLYQYLYSGRVLLPPFYTDAIPDDVLWLRAFKLAHGTMFQSLLKLVYKRIRELLNGSASFVPSPLFIEELHEDEQTPMVNLQTFVVAHTAYWIFNDSNSNWGDWEEIMEGGQWFGKAVACQLAKLHSDRYEGSKKHPTDDEDFDDEYFFGIKVREFLVEEEKFVKEEDAPAVEEEVVQEEGNDEPVPL